MSEFVSNYWQQQIIQGIQDILNMSGGQRAINFLKMVGLSQNAIAGLLGTQGATVCQYMRTRRMNHEVLYRLHTILSNDVPDEKLPDFMVFAKKDAITRIEAELLNFQGGM